jgi:hypothetical protein
MANPKKKDSDKLPATEQSPVQNKMENTLEKPSHQSWTWLSAVSWLAILSLGFSLYGYGVLMAAGERFGLSHGMLFSNIFDLITLSWPGIYQTLITFGEVPTFEALISLWKHFTPIVIVTSVVAALIWTLPLLRWSWQCLTSRATMLVYWLNPRASFMNIEIKIPQKLKNYKEWSEVNKFASSIFIVGWLIHALTPILTIAVIVLTLIVTAYMPMMGYLTAEGYFYSNIIKPARCQKLLTRVEYIQAYGRYKREREDKSNKTEEIHAKCVKVYSVDEAKPFSRTGRLIAASSSYIAIYYPLTGKSERIPLANMTVTNSEKDSE